MIVGAVLVLVCLLQALPKIFPGFDLIPRLERITYDWRVRLAQNFPSPGATNLAAVFIDETTVQWLADGLLGIRTSWPFPRHLHGQIVAELAAQGARQVGFDVLFGGLNPDASPIALPKTEALAVGFTEAELSQYQTYPHLIEVPGHPPREVEGVTIESDDFFAVQLRRSSNVVLAAETGQGVFPPPLFRTNATIGNIFAPKDPDGVLRRIKPFTVIRNWHPLLQEFAGSHGFDLSKAIVEKNQIILQNSESDQRIIPIDAQQQFSPPALFPDSADAIAPALAKAYTEERLWHMGLVLAAKAMKLDLNNSIMERGGRYLVLRDDQSNPVRRIPLDASGSLLVDWNLKWNDPRLVTASYSQVLASHYIRQSPNNPLTRELASLLQAKNITGLSSFWQTIIPSAGDHPFRNRLVVIGSIMVGSNLSDLGATALESETYLISTHWNVANSIITGRFIQPSTYGLEFLLILCLGLLAGWLTWELRALTAAFWVAFFVFFYVGASIFSFAQWRIDLPIILPVLGALLSTHVCLVTYRVVVEQHERWRIKSVFAKVVSPDVVNELLNAEQLSLGGARRQVSVYFADVRGFTEMTDVSQAKADDYVREKSLSGHEAEQIFDEQAREVLSTVNLYLGSIADIIKQHKGTLDKYIGDCVMAFWGAPIPNEEHALCAVRAAIDAQRMIHTLNQQRSAENQRREQENVERANTGQPLLPMQALLSLGTGINTGIVTVGLMGSSSHFFNYTVFGREVNLASRLEGVSGWGRIIISEATFKEIQRLDPNLAATCIEQEPVAVKGIRKPVRIFEVPWRTAGTSPPPALPPLVTGKPGAHIA